MKITLESTGRVVTLQTTGNDTVRARIWQGETESGIPVHAFIALIVPEVPEDDTRHFEFERAFEPHAAPRPPVEAIPLRLLI